MLCVPTTLYYYHHETTLSCKEVFGAKLPH